MSNNLDLLEDACGRLPHTTRSMFGGHGLFAPNGGIFACIVDSDRVVLKFADATPRDELIALGGAPWTYAEKMTMREWIVIPHDLYDDTELLANWVKRAYTLAPAKKAKASAKSKAGKTTKRKPAKKKRRPKK